MTIKADIACSLLALSIVALPARATTPPPPEPVLVPVAAAHAMDSAGFVWKSEVSFLYTGVGPSFVLISGNPTVFRMDPGQRGSIPIVDDTGLHGLILYVESSGVASFFGTSRVYCSEAPGLGVVVPLVRRSDLTARKPLQLLSVPFKRATRIMVRIYDLLLHGDTDATVNVYSSSGNLLRSDVVHLGFPPVPFPDFPRWPAYGEYVPQVDATDTGSISIEVVPLTDSALLWAFATATDSGSEVVAAVFPAR